MKKVYKWLLEKSKHPHAFWYLGAVSFTESFMSFIPPDPLLVPMIIARPKKAYLLALWTTFTSVAGGAIGYVIGYFLFKKFGVPILKTYGLMEKMAAFQDMFHKWGFWAIILKALTPIPFKLVTITAGAVHFNFGLFVLACTLSRGIRFFAQAVLVYYFGEHMHAILEKHVTTIVIAFFAVLVAGFFIARYLF